MPFTQREKYTIFFIAAFTLFLPLGPILINSIATDLPGYAANLKDQWTKKVDPITYEEDPQNDGVKPNFHLKICTVMKS